MIRYKEIADDYSEMKDNQILSLLTVRCSECSGPMLNFCIEKCCSQAALFCYGCQHDMHFLHNTHRLELLLVDDVVKRSDSHNWKSIVDGLQQLVSRAQEIEQTYRQIRAKYAAILKDVKRRRDEYMSSHTHWERDLVQSVDCLKKGSMGMDDAKKMFQRGVRGIDVLSEADFSVPDWRDDASAISKSMHTTKSLFNIYNSTGRLVTTPTYKNPNNQHGFLASLATRTYKQVMEPQSQNPYQKEFPDKLNSILCRHYGSDFVAAILPRENPNQCTIKDLESIVNRLPHGIKKLRIKLCYFLPFVSRKESNRTILPIVKELPLFPELRQLFIEGPNLPISVSALKLMLQTAVRCNMIRLHLDSTLAQQFRRNDIDLKSLGHYSLWLSRSMVQAAAMEKYRFIRNCPHLNKQEILRVCSLQDDHSV